MKLILLNISLLYIFIKLIFRITFSVSSTTNLALKKKAYMPEAYNQYTADKAVDGIDDTYFSDHCAHGQSTSNWLVVDLDGLYWIGEVHITSTNYLGRKIFLLK